MIIKIITGTILLFIGSIVGALLATATMLGALLAIFFDIYENR